MCVGVHMSVCRGGCVGYDPQNIGMCAERDERERYPVSIAFMCVSV